MSYLRGINKHVATFRHNGNRGDLFEDNIIRQAVEDQIVALVQRAAGLMDLGTPQINLGIKNCYSSKIKHGHSTTCGEIVIFYMSVPLEMKNTGVSTLRISVHISASSNLDKDTCKAILKHFREIVAQTYV